MKSKVVDDHITSRSTRSKKASIVEESDIEENQFVKRHKRNEIEGGPSKNKTRKDKYVGTKNTSNKSIGSRSSPRPLYDSLRFLSNSQKNTLVDMGFGFLIGMNIHFMPSTLSRYIVQNFNQSSMCIKLRNDSIEITPKLVKEVLGIPLGGQGLVKISNHELKARWKAQFNKHITPKRVAEMIKKTNEAGIMFKLNFLVVFYNVMCASKEDGGSNLAILDYISEDVEIRNLDWCTFVWDCLKDTKEPTTYYCGSVTLLTLIYLHCTKCDEVNVMRSRPAITSWTSDLMKDREDFEIDNGGFGNLELLPIDEEFFKEQSSQKDLQFVKDKIEANLFILSDERNKLQKFIRDSILMFPDNIKLKELKGMFDDLFCQKKVDDPKCSRDLIVIDVDDPTVKKTNHDDQGVEETRSSFPSKQVEQNVDGVEFSNPGDNDVGDCSNATVENTNDVADKEEGKMYDVEKQNDEELEAVNTQRKRRGQPKKLGRRGRPKKRNENDKNEAVEIPKHAEGTAGDADFGDEETVADKDEGKKDDVDKQNDKQVEAVKRPGHPKKLCIDNENDQNEDVEAKEIVDYIKMPGWPKKRERDNEIEDLESLKRKCTGQPSQAIVAHASPTAQPLQVIIAQASLTAQASQIPRRSQAAILHASPIRMTKNSAKRRG